MIDLRRLQGLLIASALVGLPLLLLHRALTLVWPPDSVSPYQSQVAPGHVNAIGQKLAADLDQNHGQLRRPGVFLGVVIGASTGNAADLPTLKNALAQPSAWYNYCPSGANASDLNRLMLLLRKFEVKPDYLIICLNPIMMADLDRDGEGGPFPNAKNFSRQARDFMLQTRLRVLRLFAQDSAGVVFAPNAHPPGLVEADTQPQGAPLDEVQRLLVTIRRSGCFNAERYPQEGINHRALVDMIRSQRGLDTKVFVVLPPETSYLRSLVPPKARRSLFSALESCVGKERPVVLDFSRFLDDSWFWDCHHIAKGGEGRKIFSRELGRRIRDAESTRPSSIQEVLPPIGPSGGPVQTPKRDAYAEHEPD